MTRVAPPEPPSPIFRPPASPPPAPHAMTSQEQAQDGRSRSRLAARAAWVRGGVEEQAQDGPLTVPLPVQARNRGAAAPPPTSASAAAVCSVAGLTFSGLPAPLADRAADEI